MNNLAGAAALPRLNDAIARRAGYKIRRYFPDCQPGCKAGSLRVEDHVSGVPGQPPICRVLYAPHMDIFAAGAEHRERLFLKANRVGGTEAGALEMTLHLTGAYDTYAPWWKGRRFNEPTRCWAAGDTGKTTRDIIQEKLLGPLDRFGTGMIPAHLIEDKSTKPGVPDAVETVWVRHVEREHGAPCTSLLSFKSFDQRREAFQGTAQHFIWIDEECPPEIYSECVLRTAKTTDFPGGIILITFTPLMGLTPLVLQFLPGGTIGGASETQEEASR